MSRKLSRTLYRNNEFDVTVKKFIGLNIAHYEIFENKLLDSHRQHIGLLVTWGDVSYLVNNELEFTTCDFFKSLYRAIPADDWHNILSVIRSNDNREY